MYNENLSPFLVWSITAPSGMWAVSPYHYIHLPFTFTCKVTGVFSRTMLPFYRSIKTLIPLLSGAKPGTVPDTVTQTATLLILNPGDVRGDKPM